MFYCFFSRWNVKATNSWVRCQAPQWIEITLSDSALKEMLPELYFGILSYSQQEAPETPGVVRLPILGSWRTTFWV